MSKIIVIAGTHSGVGKTTVSMGLMAYFVNQNMTVQPFKVGPDYIDPTHHSAICKRPSINLDTYLMSKAGVRETISKTIGDADISIVEGVMGLFDGMDSTEIASTAHVAKSIGAPVILVVNVKGMSRSAAALIKGYMEFDNKLNIKGVILNQVGSMRHVELIKNSLPENVKIVGALPKNENVKVPSRHLGLYMASERNHDISIISQFIEENVDTNAILSIAEDNSFEPMNVKNDDDYLNENKENQRFSSANISSRNVHKENQRFSSANISSRNVHKEKITIGIARDDAFCFYYQEMFKAFENCGANIEFFSPINSEIPEVDGLYFGGGYPELYLSELEKSKTTKKLKQFASDGMPIYGECGGLIYLCNSYEKERTSYRMADIFPAIAKNTNRLQALGYTKAIAKGNFIQGTLKGHEFHYSTIECMKDAKFAYEMIRGKGIKDKKDGIFEYNAIASYMHAHPYTFPVEKFVEQCRKYKRS